ncbi:MAG TPA: phytanoyl-CoA dioxygenase family protein [Tepidisphaeraceae bacterium]|nr:phytanoyl-CoA dioxygenase family protein [Tepidisphaeraceae bacterium]
MEFSDEHMAALVKRGFVVVPKFLEGEELAGAVGNMGRYFPSVEELEGTPERYGFIHEDPEHLQVEFPFAGSALNSITVGGKVREIVRKLLKTDEILLSQAAVWAKYAGTGDFEQGLHLDYQGNTLVVPRDDGAYRQVNMILYYTDVTMEMGPTYVVPAEKTQGVPMWPTHRTRKGDPGMYKEERPVLAGAGDLLIFSMRTWHRASAMLAERGVRLTHHMVWRAKEHAFQGYHLWAQKGEEPGMMEFIENSQAAEREVLGFPKAGDAYWNEETVAAVKMRYPGMDVRMYRKRKVGTKGEKGTNGGKIKS